jgi:hypothetical protein
MPMQFRWKIFSTELRTRARACQKTRWLFEQGTFSSAEKLISIADRVPRNRRDRSSSVQFLKNAASDALDPGTSRRFAGAGYV